MKALSALVASLFIQSASAACPAWVRVLWKAEAGALGVSHAHSEAREYCQDPGDRPDSNVELVLRRGNDVFRRRMFTVLTARHERVDDRGNISGVGVPLTTLYLDTLVPDWHASAHAELRVIKSGRLLGVRAP